MANRNSVAPAKLAKMKELVERTLDGDRIASAMLSESISTSDAPLALAQIINANILPKYQALEPQWQKVATPKTVTNFRNVRFIDILGSFANLTQAQAGIPQGILPVVPELAPYPYVSVQGTELEAALTKQGAKFGFSWEEYKDDPINFLADFPDQFLWLAANTEEYSVFNTLATGVTAFSALQAGVSPVDQTTTVPVNSHLSLGALSLAIQQIALRRLNGRLVGASSYKLVVPPALEILANAIVHFTNLSFTDGSVQYDAAGFVPLGNVEVVVSDWLPTSTNWYLVPSVGAAARYGLARLTLAGEEAPEIRLANFTGTTYGGSSTISPFEGGFENDSIDFRVRTVGAGALVTEESMVWSLGTV